MGEKLTNLPFFPWPSLSKTGFFMSVRILLWEHPVFSALVSPAEKNRLRSRHKKKISVTSAVSDQSQFTLHIRRSNAQFFAWISRKRVGKYMAEYALRKEWEVFGFERLNKHQEEALRLVVESKRDVFVNLPTSFGKSVVFQALSIVYCHVQPTN